MTVLWVLIGAAGIAGFVGLLRHFHRQSEFERDDHVVPEQYD